MAESGSRDPASTSSKYRNIDKIIGERGPNQTRKFEDAARISDLLQEELKSKGLKGFKKGGKVKKTGPYKLHKGEVVVPAKQAKGAKADMRLLKQRMPR